MQRHVLNTFLTGFIIMFFLSGCSSAPVAPQKPWVPISGDLVWVEAKPIETMHHAILKILTDMKLSTTKEKYDSLSGIILAKNLDGQEITIKLHPETSETTRVSIRVGFWSDRKQARIIYNKVLENL
jgi:hypothetical protein